MPATAHKAAGARLCRAFALALFALPAWGATYYAGPTSQGLANGTSPANRWAHSAVNWAAMTSGDTLVLEPGTYGPGISARMNINSVSANYSTANPLTVEGNNNVLDCGLATAHCLYLKAARGIRIQNITARNSTSSAIRFDGSDGTIGLSGITLVNVAGEKSQQCGFQVDSGATNITFRNVTGRDNFDPATNGGNGDGFCTGGSAVTPSLANVAGIVIEDSRFLNNSDDGIDLFGMMNSVVVRRNFISGNGYASGNSRGISMGYGKGAHIIESNIITGSPWYAIMRRDNTGAAIIRNNTLHNNGGGFPLGRTLFYPSTVDLNWPQTGYNVFEDSGVNGEWRVLAEPVSSLSVGATSYTLGTVGALTTNQFGNAGGYVYVKGNPAEQVVTATPVTQSTAQNNAVGIAGLTADDATGLSNGSGGNTWNIGSPDPQFIGGANPTTAEGFRLSASSPLAGAGTDLGDEIADYFGDYMYSGKWDIGAFRRDSCYRRSRDGKLDMARTRAQVVSRCRGIPGRYPEGL